VREGDRHDKDIRELIAALAAGDPEPPAALRERVLAGARGLRQEGGRVSRRGAGALAAAAALVALGVGALALSPRGPADHVRSSPKATVDAVVLLARPGRRRVRLRGAEGVLAIDRRGRAVLVVNGLARAPVGKTYEAWLIGSGPAAQAGLFGGGGELSVVTLTLRVPPGSLVAVSLERTGGSRRPHAPLTFAAARTF
jgi:anti-sigma-K factor RskA